MIPIIDTHWYTNTKTDITKERVIYTKRGSGRGEKKKKGAQSSRSERAINFAVNSSILRFSRKSRSLWPYRSRLIWSIEWKFKLFTVSTDSISLKRSVRIRLKLGHSKKKWCVVSLLMPQEQVSSGVSLKLCFSLWLLSWLKPTRIWRSERPNVSFFGGRTKL